MNYYAVLAVFSAGFILLFPIYLKINVYASVPERKIYYGFMLYSRIKIYGGYAQFTKEGIMLHISDKKAEFIYYNRLNDEKNRFKITKGFQLTRYVQTVEYPQNCTVEGVLLYSFLQILSSQYLAVLQQKKGFIRFEALLLNSSACGGNEGNKATVSMTTVFNFLVVIIALLKLLTEKILNYAKTIKRKAARKKS